MATTPLLKKISAYVIQHGMYSDNTDIPVPFAFAPIRLGYLLLRGSRATIGVAMTGAIAAMRRRAATVI